jgi:transposase
VPGLDLSGHGPDELVEIAVHHGIA